MKNFLILSLGLGLILLGVVGFYWFSQQQKAPQNLETQNVATQKQGTTVKTGVISQAGSRFFLADNLGKSQEIESYGVNLGQYVGQTVTVHGQYSGDTLFVGSIE